MVLFIVLCKINNFESVDEDLKVRPFILKLSVVLSCCAVRFALQGSSKFLSPLIKYLTL